MKHSIIIDGTEGEVHPHTWEFTFHVLKSEDDFMQFHMFEEIIETYLNKYQGKILNEVVPFDKIVPTLENVTDCFSRELRRLMQENGSELISIESSEGPTRSYIINYERSPEFLRKVEDFEKKKVDEIIDTVLVNILAEQ